MKDQNTNGKKALAVAGAIGLALAGGLAGATLFPVEKIEIVTKEVIVEKNITTEVPFEVVKEVPVNVTVEKIVKVDNENLPLVYKYIVDQEGDLTELDISEIDDNGVDELVSQIIFVNDIKSLAIAEAKSEIADLVDKEVVDTVSLDEDDVERIRIKDDFDEVTVEDIDFEDKDAELRVFGTFEHDDVDYKFEVEVEIKDGEVDDIKLISVSKE
jgi:hypothetical protein